MSQIQHSLAKIENLLATLVGSRTTTTKKMGPAEFVHYAHGQITKAIVEPPKRSTRRLKALYDSVQVFKDNYTNEESERINVPIFVDDVTAMDDKSTTLTAITAAAGAAANQSVFTQGFVAKVAALKGQLEALLKTLPDEDDDPEEKKKKADEKEPEEDEDDDEAAQADKKKAAAEDDDEAPDSEKKAAAADDDEKEKTAKVRKGVDRSPDGTKWPADVNDPAFIKDGVVTKKLNWGADPS